MHPRRIITCLLAVAGATGCASAPPAVATAPAANDRAAVLAAAGTPTRWQATLVATQQRTGMAAPTSQNKTTGSVFISPAGPGRTRVRVTVSTSVSDATSFQWAILPGRCGSDMLPITGVERFPIIHVSAGGRGELDAEIPLTMPTSGAYHVNVYRGGTALNNVLTCGNLTRQG